MKEIIVEISENCEVVVTTKGFAGQSCKAATAELEKALGVKSSDVLTREGMVQGHGSDQLTNRG